MQHSVFRLTVALFSGSCWSYRVTGCGNHYPFSFKNSIYLNYTFCKAVLLGSHWPPEWNANVPKFEDKLHKTVTIWNKIFRRIIHHVKYHHTNSVQYRGSKIDLPYCAWLRDSSSKASGTSVIICLHSVRFKVSSLVEIWVAIFYDWATPAMIFNVQIRFFYCTYVRGNILIGPIYKWVNR